MKKHLIPQTDLEVSQFCFGAGGLGTSVKGEHTDQLIIAFMNGGGNFFDTAHCYAFWKPNGLGASEKELGDSLRRLGVWDQAIIATKGGHPDGGPSYQRPGDFLSESIINSDIDDSLNRLQTNCLDLYYLHRDDGVTPVADIIEILNRQISKGRLRFIGASNWSVNRMKAANEYAQKRSLKGFVISQVQWSLSEPDWAVTSDPTMRHVGKEEIEWHLQTKIPIAAYSATGNGFFSKTCTSTNTLNRKRWDIVNKISKKIGKTPTQVALAWLLQQNPTVLPVFSTTNMNHLEEIIHTDQVELSKEMIEELR